MTQSKKNVLIWWAKPGTRWTRPPTSPAARKPLQVQAEKNDEVRKPRDRSAAMNHGFIMNDVVNKTYGTVSADRQIGMSGLEFVNGLFDLSLPLNRCSRYLGYD